MTNIRNIGDKPRYCVRSHQRGLTVVPVAMVVGGGGFTSREGMHASVGVSLEPDILVFRLAPDVGWDADAFYFFLVGADAPGGQVVTGHPDLSQIRLTGIVRIPILPGYTGRIEGYVGSIHYAKPGTGLRSALDAPMGAYKRKTAAPERNNYPVCSTVEDLVFAPIRFQGGTPNGDVDLANRGGPLTYDVEHQGGGIYRVTFAHNFPNIERWVMIGTTSFGQTISRVAGPQPASNVIDLEVKSGGAPGALTDGEHVSVLIMGPYGGAADYHGGSGTEAFTLRRNYVGVYKAEALIRDPLFDPFNLVIGPTGEVGTGAGSIAPAGTSFQQEVPLGVEYQFNHGIVPTRFTPAGKMNTWASGDALLVASPENIAVFYDEIATEGWTRFIATGTPAPAPDGRMMGWVLLSTNSQQ